MKPEEKTSWDEIIASAKTPEERAAVLKKVLAQAGRELAASGFSEAGWEAIVAEVMASADDDE